MPKMHTAVFSKLNKLEDTTLVQLVYVSSMTLGSRFSMTIFEEVESHARNFNQQQGITGTLCYGNGHFLQCIEGEKDKIAALTQRIFADNRHKHVQVLLLQAIKQRSFTDWRMRLLFLERWLWSPAAKKQAAQLSPFLPFAPHHWSAADTEQFLQVIKAFDTPPHINAAGITYNALGNMVRHIAAPHQAFLVVQGFLSVLLAVGLVLLYI
ncbi:BLUF domain-containing protein [Psychrobacter sp.]|uniref:BLUF domain-containing protein n=1 Tax=Psychrobacter sp. TaxID=56811 RepID=UPI003564FCBA